MSEDKWRHLARFLGIDLAELMQMECRETLAAVRRKLEFKAAGGRRSSGMSSIGEVLGAAAGGLDGRRNGRGPH